MGNWDLDELDIEEAEGAAEGELDLADELLDLEDEELDDVDDLDADDLDMLDSEDGDDFLAEDDGEDDLYGLDEYEFGEEDEDDWEDADSFEDDLAFALAAESDQEFFKRLGRLAKKAVKFARKKVIPAVAKYAPGVGKALTAIPHPWAQAAGRAAQVAGRVAKVINKLKAEGASAEEGLEVFAEMAARDPRVAPMAIGMAARSITKGKGRRMSQTQRKVAVRRMVKAAQRLLARRGPKAIRAFAKVTKGVKRTTAAKGPPAAVRPKVVQRTAERVARSPLLVRNLSRPSPQAKRVLGRVGGISGSRHIVTLPGRGRIMITVL